jgi:hypothetical protein
MSAAYEEEVRAHCPRALIVYDLFHVVAKYGREGATRTPSEPKARGGGAVQEMGVGPPEPLCRGRFQTTASCVG